MLALLLGVSFVGPIASKKGLQVRTTRPVIEGDAKPGRAETIPLAAKQFTPGTSQLAESDLALLILADLGIIIGTFTEERSLSSNTTVAMAQRRCRQARAPSNQNITPPFTLRYSNNGRKRANGRRFTVSSWQDSKLMPQKRPSLLRV
jgi:hypothetical protein